MLSLKMKTTKLLFLALLSCFQLIPVYCISDDSYQKDDVHNISHDVSEVLSTLTSKLQDLYKIAQQITRIKTSGEEHKRKRNEFLPSFAYQLYKMYKDYFYATIYDDFKPDVKNITGLLPKNLRYILFETYFCLSNTEDSKFLYTAIKENEHERTKNNYVWLYYGKSPIDETSFIIAEFIIKNFPDVHVEVILKGLHYDMYYYMTNDTKAVVGWDEYGAPPNCNWNVEFIGDDLVRLSQNEYIMCAAENYFNEERRNVKGFNKTEHSLHDPKCKWRITKCPDV